MYFVLTTPLYYDDSLLFFVLPFFYSLNLVVVAAIYMGINYSLQGLFDILISHTLF